MLDLPVFGRGEAGATTGARGVASGTGFVGAVEVGAAAVGRAGAVALPSLPAMRENSPRMPERRAFAGLLSLARRARVDIWDSQRRCSGSTRTLCNALKSRRARESQRPSSRGV